MRERATLSSNCSKTIVIDLIPKSRLRIGIIQLNIIRMGIISRMYLHSREE